MKRSLAASLGAPALILALAGCPDPDVFEELEPATFETEEEAAAWSGMSAPNMLFGGQFFILAPLLDGGVNPESAEVDCPARDEGEDGITFTGGCTDADGRQWSGRLRIVEAGDPMSLHFPGGSTTTDVSTIETDDFGFEATVTCGGEDHAVFARSDGALSLTADGDGARTFEVAFSLRTSTVDDDCVREETRLGLDYSGRVTYEDPDEDGLARRSVWNGSGRGGTHEMGLAQVETVDEVIDVTQCPETPLSGHTRATAGGRTLEIRYVGAEDCDPDAKAEWYLDGEKQGEILGVNCATGSGASWPALLALSILAFCALRRRGF